jgi:ATP-binding cassette subfamily F protein 3
MTELAVRSLLGGVRLTGDDVYKRVGDLSGGERAKLRMAIMTLERGNVLILDEPTNHLDISTRDVLESALGSFTGTMLFVSHDRYLLSRLATRIVEVTTDGLAEYGDFESYIESRKSSGFDAKSDKSDKSGDSGTPRPTAGNHRSKAQRAEESQRRVRIKTLESEIERLESLTRDLQADMENPEVFANHELLQEKCRLFEDAKAKLAELTDEWLLSVDN